MKHDNDNAPTKWAYYNEFDPYAAQWLRNLIKAGHIAPGEVDERSIADVHADELKGFTQCHFFAGIGGWSLAARLAGWPDERPLWTGSCPCQPFSVAGKGKGQADERHLWPVFFNLIKARRPPVVMGEQVAAAVGKSWLDGVFTDLESLGYSAGAAVVPACAVNAPHRRDRLWFVADAQSEQNTGVLQQGLQSDPTPSSNRNGHGSIMADTNYERRDGQHSQPEQAGRNVVAINSGRPLANADSNGCKTRSITATTSRHGDTFDAEGGAVRSNAADTDNTRPQGYRRSVGQHDAQGRQEQDGYGTENSFWHGAEYLTGPDGKARRIEPSIRLLAHGVPARVGKLRAYGNAIVPQVAAEIIRSYMDCHPQCSSLEKRSA